jgi:hypothetical protein
MVLPVAQALQAQRVRVCIFALTTAIAIVETGGVPYFSYADLPRAQDPHVRSTGTRLAAEMLANAVLPLAETQAYLGINYCDMEVTHGVDQAARKWENGGRQHFHPRPTMEAVIGELAPRLVVTTNSPRSEQAAIEAATALDVPAVAMVDMFAMQEVKWLSRPDFGKKLCVLDDSVKEMFTRHGRPAADIVVTGNPAFDGLHDSTVIADGAAMRTARGWGQAGRFTILSASTPEPILHPFTKELANPALPRAVENHLRSLVAADPRLDLVIRRHPSEDQGITPGDRIHASPRADDINALIHAVDLVVVTCSTVGLQAYLAGIPVISVEGSVFTKDAPYGDFGMATPVADLTGLGTALSGILPGLERAERRAERQATQRRPQKAVDRIVAVLQHHLDMA